MDGYSKLFANIVTSTIWCEDNETRILWITMLAISDRYGNVAGSVPGLAALARIPLDSCRTGIAKLMAPDPDSRSKENEGRRIEEIEGGWHILNYTKYRQVQRSAERREYLRIKKRESRAKKSGLFGENEEDNTVNNESTESQHGQPCQPIAEAEAEAEAKENKNIVETPHQKPLDEQFEEFRKIYPGSKRGFEVEFGDFQRKHKNWREIVPLLMPAVIAQRERRRSMAAAGKFVPEWKNLKTWLNQSCWTEECGSNPGMPDNSNPLVRTPEQEAKILKDAHDAFIRQIENGGKQ